MELKKNSHRDVIPYVKKKLGKSSIGGVFRKTVFHIHTPESHDYQLINEETQKKLFKSIKNHWSEFSLKELIEISKYVKLLLPEVGDYSGEEFKKYLDKDFNSVEEVLAYLILGHSLLTEKVELCLVTDHNTIRGFFKLKKAINILLRQPVMYPIKTRVELGIEISCSDKNHIVGILDQNDQNQLKNIKNWLNDNVISGIDGTIRTSFDVFKMLKEINSIGYIAHINTSNIFNKGYLSGSYKKQLFKEDLFFCIGITDKNQQRKIENNLSFYGKKEYCFVIDNDSHNIEKLKQGFFFLKADKLNFAAIKAALNDYKLSISLVPVETPKQFIRGIYIEGKDFISDKKENDPFSLAFSKNMNTFIGGRGTGKSTVLSTIGFLTSQYVENQNELEKVLAQGTSCLVYSYYGDDYYIFFNSSDDENNSIFLNQYYYSPEDSRRVAIEKRIQVYKYEDKKIINCTNTLEILNKIFTRKYSTNELVNIAEDERETTVFIEKVLFENKKLKNNRSYYKMGKGIDGLINKYKNKQITLDSRKTKIDEILKDFNATQKDKLYVEYSQKEISSYDFYWYDSLGISEYSNNKYYKKYAITFESLNAYLSKLADDLGNPIEVILKFVNKNFSTLFELESPIKYFIQNDIRVIEKNLKFIKDEKEILEFYNSIRKTFLLDRSVKYAKDFLLNYFYYSDQFNLLFNINNKESVKTEKNIFKDVSELSMGQKVVALLSFILSYGEYSNDFTPFIIDQPEDNLDNQYIYKNLVKEFRKLKSSRQIIIASHNSTIVVNSGCEKVIVMDSNNKKGWCETSGYSANPKILKYVINILEGGDKAISDKLFLYKGKLNHIDDSLLYLSSVDETTLNLKIFEKIENLCETIDDESKNKLLNVLENFK